MKDIEKFLIWLAQFNLSQKKVDDILNLCHDYDILSFPKISGLDKIFKFQDLEDMRAKATSISISNYFDSLQRQNINVITGVSELYPQKLTGICNPPSALFCKGDLSLLDKFAISIVGARTPSNYGRIITDDFSGSLAKSGVVIISGLAYGIDSIAHKRALEVGGKTIAVLGSGFNHIYPTEHTNLADEIAQKELLISEYSPSTKPSKYSFVERNRIIAGLGDGVLIPEAGLKSGTRSTKDFALDFGRDVFAIPGAITNEKSELPNLLISCGHAKCVLSPKDILEEYNLKLKPKVSEVKQTSAQEDVILSLLADGEKDVAFLQENSGFDIKNLNSYLTLLEIRGIIRKLPGNFYATT